MFPWARLVVTSLHLAEDHHALPVSEPAATEHAVATLEEAFHGHHHDDDDATRHDHPLVGCDFSAQRSRVLEAVTAPPASSSAFVAMVPARMPDRALSRNSGVRDHGPPGVWAQGAILRI